jgi:hypothetical protein
MSPGTPIAPTIAPTIAPDSDCAPTSETKISAA